MERLEEEQRKKRESIRLQLETDARDNMRKRENWLRKQQALEKEFTELSLGYDPEYYEENIPESARGSKVEEAAEEANHPVFGQIGANKITHGATFVSNITQSNQTERPNKPCKACQGDHFILKCQTFKDMTISERLTLVREKRICMNCLKPGHKNTECWAG